MDSFARMIAPRIAVATSFEHFTPRPTCPLKSPIATNAYKMNKTTIKCVLAGFTLISKSKFPDLVAMSGFFDYFKLLPMSDYISGRAANGYLDFLAALLISSQLPPPIPTPYHWECNYTGTNCTICVIISLFLCFL